MLELVDSPHTTPFDPLRADDAGDAALDALPFGVIALDAEGTILRYNLYESRFARLDRNQIIGRNFFAEVAPCTRNERFEGRFRAFVAQGPEHASLEKFDFLFDFKFGAQHVSVEIARAAGGARFYLFINRTKIAGPTPDFPKEQLAVEQRALAPNEAAQGVLRDTLERRFVDAPSAFFGALRATCDRLAPETWQLFANEWGLQWGRRVAVDLEASALEGGVASLRELPMREVARLVSTFFAERGWGAPRFDFAAVNEGVLVVDLERSALAEAAPRSLRAGARGGDLTCYLVAGCLAGVLSSVAGRRLAGREVACASGGAPRCSIIVIGHERRAAADAALEGGARGVEAVRAALRRAPREGGSR